VTAKHIYLIIGELYTMSGKKRREYSRHYFDKFKQSFAIFDTNHHDISM